MDADSVVLVTGGTGRLGQAVVERTLATGATVVTTYIEDDEWEALRERHGTEQLHGYKTDVTADGQVQGLVEKVVERHGQVDALLHLVGAWRGGDTMDDVEEDTWDMMLDVNLKSAFLVLRHVLPHMREQGYGRIVCIGSRIGHELPAEGGPYAVSKHGLEALTSIVSKEQEDDITMDCVLPSTISEDASDDGETPGVVADVVLDAAGDAETGRTIPVYAEEG